MRVSTERHSTGYAHKNLHLIENKQKLTNCDANALKIQFAEQIAIAVDG